jgi:hypothetical protein
LKHELLDICPQSSYDNMFVMHVPGHYVTFVAISFLPMAIQYFPKTPPARLSWWRFQYPLGHHTGLIVIFPVHIRQCK